MRDCRRGPRRRSSILQSRTAPDVAWFQGNETTKLPAFDNFNFSIQRQVGNSMVAEIGYSGVMGSHLQTQLLQYNTMSPSDLTKFGTVAQSIMVLNSQVGSAAANAAGVFAPYPTFKGTVAQALRPFPQYTGIDTYAGQGDHSGHSTYHAMILKFQKRYSAGLTFTSSYVFSKILTDSDTAWGGGYAADQFNRASGEVDRRVRCHARLQIRGHLRCAVRPRPEVPQQGSGELDHGQLARVVHQSLCQRHAGRRGHQPDAAHLRERLRRPRSGLRTSYDGWQPQLEEREVRSSVDNFFVPYGTGPFPTQGSGTALNSLGNETRYNPKLRLFPNLNENMSVTRTFPIWEKTRLEFRAEAFNVFNRVRFGTGSTQLQSSTFGVLTGSGSQINAPRSLQLALKLYF